MMEYNNDSVFTTKVKAGKKRTYFFDVKATRTKDFFVVITESVNRFDNKGGFDRHKIFVYKEDFNKFVKGLNEAVDFVKTELMPNFNFDAFSNDYMEHKEEPNTLEDKAAVQNEEQNSTSTIPNETVDNHSSTEDVDKW